MYLYLTQKRSKPASNESKVNGHKQKVTLTPKAWLQREVLCCKPGLSCCPLEGQGHEVSGPTASSLHSFPKADRVSVVALFFL